MVPRLTVTSDDLRAALRQLTRLVSRRQQNADAVLSFADGELLVEVPGGAVSMPADGSWSGQVRVPARFLLGPVRAAPVTGPSTIFVESGRLHVGSLSAPCVWEQEAEKRIELPLDAPWTLVLSVGLRHDADAIVRSGLTKLLAAAEDRRDGLIRRAAEVLAPLGVQPADLREVVDACVLRDTPAV